MLLTVNLHPFVWNTIDTINRTKKKLIKPVEQLNKLLLKVIELLGTITLLILAVKSLIEIVGG